MAATAPMFTAIPHLQTYQLLNCDDHGRYLGRLGKDPAEYRPDICHQVCIELHARTKAATAAATNFAELPSSMVSSMGGCWLDAGAVGDLGQPSE